MRRGYPVSYTHLDVYKRQVNGRGTADMITSRINQIKSQIETTTSDYDKEKLQERLAKLAGGVAVLYVGAATEAVSYTHLPHVASNLPVLAIPV